MRTAPPGSDPAPSPHDDPADLDGFVRDWATVMVSTTYLPMSRTETEAYLRRQAERLAEIIRAEPFVPEAAHGVGLDLVGAHLATPETLGRTLQIVCERLVDVAGLAHPAGMTEREARARLAAVIAALAIGHSQALHDRTLDEQEAIRQAASQAREQAEAALRDSEARIRHQATHDLLTDLPNRALLTSRLTRLCVASGGQRLIGLCAVDVDGFKEINDAYGHQVGDHVLTALANRLMATFGPRRMIARMGGDEFIVLVERPARPEDAIQIANAALRAVAEPLVVDGHELRLTASAGVVVSPADGADPTEVLRGADVAVNWAKQGGRGRWVLFDPERDNRDVARYVLSTAIPTGLDRDEFYLDYQPLVSLGNGVVIGAEALLRWRHPSLGVLGPDRFIDLAEQSGQIVRLGAKVLDLACTQARRWLDHTSPAPYVSVNLSVRQVHHPGLVEFVTATLNRTGLPARLLQLEITESAVIGTDDASIGALRRIADMGIRIAIDDFGTGYSNLSYLKALPVHELKIDASFVAGLRPGVSGRPDVDEHILRTMVEMAHALGLTVTAEGVETAEQADRLRRLGCDAGQGWHLGVPGPAELIPLMVHA